MHKEVKRDVTLTTSLISCSVLPFLTSLIFKCLVQWLNA
jgi:hypothetical protein